MTRFSCALLVSALWGCASPTGPVIPSPSPTPAPTAPAIPCAPTAPGVPTGPSLTFVSGETQAPAAGACVTVAGSTYTTDANGQITLLAPLNSKQGNEIDVLSEMFLERRTRLSPPQTLFTLWPRTSPTGLTEDFTREVGYTARGAQLLRWAPTIEHVSIVPSREVRRIAIAMEAHRAAAAQLTEITEGRIVFTVETAPRPGPHQALVESVTDPSDPFPGGSASLRKSGFEIVGGTISFHPDLSLHPDLRQSFFNVVAHELGHIFGLGHSRSPDDVMESPTEGRATRYSPRERLLMRLMLQRRAGNRFPDDDRDLSQSSSSALTETVAIRCFGSP